MNWSSTLLRSRYLIGTLLPIAVVIGLGWALVGLPSDTGGLYPHVAQELVNSGVENPVTAVLMNFRGYDTLLELSVLMLAVCGVWSFGALPGHTGAPPGLVLEYFIRLLIPLILLVAAYLLWTGKHSPGGAFQAGAVLSTTGVLIVLGGWRPSVGIEQTWVRLIITAGVWSFLLVAVTSLVLHHDLLQYPNKTATAFILTIETLATFAIAISLGLLFLATAPSERESL